MTPELMFKRAALPSPEPRSSEYEWLRMRKDRNTISWR